MPDVLEYALRKQAGMETENVQFPEENTAFAVRERAGCEGGGKGPLVQVERSGTLGTNNDQKIFTICGNIIGREGKNGGHHLGVREDVSFTLNTVDRHAVAYEKALILNDQGGSIMNVSENTVGTLRAESHGHEPLVFDARGNRKGGVVPTITGDHENRITDYTGIVIKPPKAFSFDSLSSNSMKSKNPNSGCREVDVSKTLDTTSQDPNKNQGGIAILENKTTFSDVASTLRSGAGMPKHMSDIKGRLVYDPQKEAAIGIDHTITTGGNCTAEGKCYYPDREATLKSCGVHSVCTTEPAVRRLTPLECERLQGFPDGWTDIEGASDTARYKALGNSIALPPWKWVLKRISAQYERDATMASLFDGIGGFPLIWEQINGKGSCLWSSEIEKFPIKVTEERFGEREKANK